MQLSGDPPPPNMNVQDFVGRWVRYFLYYEAPPWVFTAAYTLFGAAVASIGVAFAALTVLVVAAWPHVLAQAPTDDSAGARPSD